MRGRRSVNTDNPKGTYDVLKKYGRDIVSEARAHKLDPVIGRDEEIRNVIRILSRKTKNNPCLIGAPGVGKAAIASLAIEDLLRRLSLSVTDRAIEHIIEAAYDPIFGARPLKRYIKSKTETLLARKILSENPAPDTEFLLDCDGDGLKIQ